MDKKKTRKAIIGTRRYWAQIARIEERLGMTRKEARAHYKAAGKIIDNVIPDIPQEAQQVVIPVQVMSDEFIASVHIGDVVLIVTKQNARTFFIETSRAQARIVELMEKEK